MNAKVDSKYFRNVLGNFATGVAVVTASPGTGSVGVTVNSFTSISLEPALVLFSLDRMLGSLPAFQAAQYYGIHILSASQQHISERFAARGSDKWDGFEPRTGARGVPVIDQALARLECERNQIVEAGDHLIFICRVLSLDSGPDCDPLLFFRGRYWHPDQRSSPAIRR